MINAPRLSRIRDSVTENAQSQALQDELQSDERRLLLIGKRSVQNYEV